MDTEADGEQEPRAELLWNWRNVEAPNLRRFQILSEVLDILLGGANLEMKLTFMETCIGGFGARF